MNIYAAAPVSEEPEIFLSRWSVRRTNEGVLHLVGFNIATGDGRVSTGVVKFDNSERTALTMSGRRYILVGPGGYDGDAEYVWNWAVRAWKVTSWRDVTVELAPDWRQGLTEAECGLEGPRDALSIEDSGDEIEPEEVDLTAEGGEERVCGRLVAYRLEQADVRKPSELLAELRLEGDVANSLQPFRSETYRMLAYIGDLLQAHNAATTIAPIAIPPYITVRMESLEAISDERGYLLASLDLVNSAGEVSGCLTLPRELPTDLGEVRGSPEEGLWEIVAKFLLSES